MSGCLREPGGAYAAEPLATKEHRGVGPRRLEAEQGPASAPGAKEEGKTLPGEARDPSEGLPPSGISLAQRHGAGRVTAVSRLVAKRDAVFSTSKSSRSSRERHRTCRAVWLPAAGKGLLLRGPCGRSSARCPPVEQRKAAARLTWKESTFPQLFQSPILFTPC